MAKPKRDGAPRGKRLACFEWVRAAGCVAIIFLHVVVSLEIAVGTDALGSLRRLADDLAMVVLGRWAVPVFLMVSGALLLDQARRLTWADVWRYVSRMLFVLATFGLAFCLIESVYSHGGLSLAVVGEAAWNLLIGNSWGHLWYVYAMLFVYLLTPAFRELTKGLSKESYALLLAVLYACVLVVPTVLGGRWVGLFLPFNVVPACFYYLLGQFAWRYVRPSAGVWACGLVSLGALVWCAVTGRTWLALPEYCLVAPFALLTFVLFRTYATAPLTRWPWAELLAAESFGIYVVHPFFIHVITHLVDPLVIPAGLFEVGTFAIALVGSVAAVTGLRQIPLFADKL